MNNLPYRAKLLLVSVYVLAAGVAVWAALYDHPAPDAPLWELVTLAVLAIIAGGNKIQVIGRDKAHENGSLTLGFAIIIASMLRAGPLAAVAIGCLSCLSSCLFPKRQPFLQVSYNLALTAVQWWAAGLVYIWLNMGELAVEAVHTLPAAALAGLTFFLINSAGVTGIISLCRDVNPLPLWKETVFGTGPVYLVGATIIALAIVVFRGDLGLVLLVGAPMAFLAYHTYAVNSQLAEERQRRIEVLQRSSAEINSLNERLQRAMAETHHRVKNNLQVVSGLIELLIMDGAQNISENELRRLNQHVRSLAVLHDILTQQARTDGHVDSLSTKDALDRLVPLLRSVTGSRPLTYFVDDTILPISHGTSLAVLLNELVSNAVKHGGGSIDISLAVVDDQARLEVADDGPGFPADFAYGNATHTGLELVENVSRYDLHGEPRYENRPEGGARVVVTFPLRPEEELVA